MTSLGRVHLDAPFFQAGLAGYSDAAMRRVARRHGAPYAVTEAMLDIFLINGGRGLKAAELDGEDHPIAGQLMGSFPNDMAKASKILVSLGYDVIDVNLACPVKKIKKRCRGGHLMSAPDEAIAILDAVRQAVPPEVPCTVKLRRGSDDSPEAEARFRKIIEAAIRLGYAGAVVHGRTVEQKYLGPARWEFLQRIVTDYNPSSIVPRPSFFSCPSPFLIGGSGDIWTARDIFRMIHQTGVQLVSVARGCIGNPWIFAQARAILKGDQEAGDRPPTIVRQRGVLLDHFDLSVKLHGEKMASMMMRKFGIKFARHHPRAQDVAKAFIAVKSVGDWRAVIQAHYTDKPLFVGP